MKHEAEERLDRLRTLLADLKRPFLVEYAYASSTIAKRLGHGSTGCYFVSALVDGDVNRPRRVASPQGFSVKADAQSLADNLMKGTEP